MAYCGRFEMIITLKDGKQLEFDAPLSAMDVTKRISEGLARAALICKINGVPSSLNEIIDKDSTFEVLTWDDDEGKAAYRHTCSHILAQAVHNIYPTASFAIGPAIKDGFYYDFDFKTPINQGDFDKIEAEMQRIIKADLPIVKTILPRKDAEKLISKWKQPYKVELLKDIPDGEEISFYTQGDFTDLCAGPHLASTGKIKAFKLISLTGAYWRGNEKNKMLTRIYGTAFTKRSDLDEYLTKLAEAESREHNKLGRDLQLFMTDETIGQGLPLLMPRGAKIMQLLQRWVEDE